MHSQVKQPLIDWWKSEFFGSNPFEMTLYIDSEGIGFSAAGDTLESGMGNNTELEIKVLTEEGYKYFSSFFSFDGMFNSVLVASENTLIPDVLEVFIHLNGSNPTTYLQKPNDAHILFCDEYTKVNGTLKINYLG